MANSDCVMDYSAYMNDYLADLGPTLDAVLSLPMSAPPPTLTDASLLPLPSASASLSPSSLGAAATLSEEPVRKKRRYSPRQKRDFGLKPAPPGLSPEERAAWDEEQRSIKNRAASKLFRSRQKDYIAGLEDNVKQGKEENAALRARVTQLQVEEQQLLDELRSLQTFMSSTCC